MFDRNTRNKLNLESGERMLAHSTIDVVLQVHIMKKKIESTMKDDKTFAQAFHDSVTFKGPNKTKLLLNQCIIFIPFFKRMSHLITLRELVGLRMFQRMMNMVCGHMGMFSHWGEVLEKGSCPVNPVCKLNAKMRKNVKEWQLKYMDHVSYIVLKKSD